jgi:hypothetical protein
MLQLENEIENLINLRHPCRAPPIGFGFPIESGSLQELKILRLYSEHCSMPEVLFVPQVWCTSTVKAKQLQGLSLVFGLCTVLDCSTAISLRATFVSIQIVAFKSLTFIQPD